MKAEFINCFIIHSKYLLILKGVSPFRSLFFRSPCPQVFAVNGSIICSRLHFWRHFDVNDSIIFRGLHFWHHWFHMAKILSKFGEQQLVMVNYACGFNQSETGKYFEWIINPDIASNVNILETIHYVFIFFLMPKGPPSGAPYPYREIKGTHELIFSCYCGQRYFTWVRTTAATMVELCNMAAIIQIIRW